MFTVDTLTGRTDNWLKWLAPFVGVECHALEIGSYEGASACWFAEHILNAQSTILCVDTWTAIEPYLSRGTDMNDVYSEFKKNVSEFPYKIQWIRGGSKDVQKCFNDARKYGATSFIGTSDFRFDFAYIDGSHWPVDVLKDSVLVFDLVKPGGVIIFDDYEWIYQGPLSTPKIAIDAFLSVYEGKYELIDKGYQVAIRKL
jgi:predicted O-methyltransferase YrrM